MLGRGTTGRHEEFVAARSVTSTGMGIWLDWSCALALARHRLGSCRQLPFAPTHPVPPALFAPALEAAHAGAVTLAGPPAPPPPRRLLAVDAAITRLGVSGTEPAFAVLEQATPAAVASLAADAVFLTWTALQWKLSGAQGSHDSRVVKSRGEARNFSSRRLCPSPDWLRTKQLFPSVYLVASLRAAARNLALMALRPWLT